MDKIDNEILTYRETFESVFLNYTMPNTKENIGITVSLPKGYLDEYGFSHIILMVGNLSYPLDIKKVFFKLLKQLPGNLMDYSNVSLHINDDRFEISNGKLSDYYDSKDRERIFVTHCDDDDDIYNYYREDDSKKYLFVSDIFNEDYYDECYKVSSYEKDGRILYAKAFVSEVNKKIKECSINNKKTKTRKRGK